MFEFKKLHNFLNPIYLFSIFLLIANTGQAQSWNPVGDPGLSEGAAWFPSIAISNINEPYVVYQDEKNDDWVSVKKFNGSEWTFVGTPGFSGREVINSLITFDKSGTPFVAFADKYYRGKASVMKFVDNAWEYVGPDRFTDGQANFLSFALDPNGVPYVAFSEYDSVMSLQVMKFENDAWVNVGNTDFADHDVTNCSIHFDNNGILYVAYVDGAETMKKGTVKRFDGASWVLVGDAAFTPSGANFFSLAFSKTNTPFVSLASGNGSKASVLKFDGNSWIDVGQKYFTTGEAYQISLLAGKNDVPSIFYTDSNFHSYVSTYLNSVWTTATFQSGLSNNGVSFGSTYAIDNDGFSYVTFVDNPNLGGISVLKSANILPVSLLSFTGKLINQEVQLNWSTSSEFNNDYFIVQRSKDGLHFNNLGKVKGKGTASAKSSYTFTDPSPYQGMMNYYRLSQVDFDGKSTLSAIVSIKSESAPNSIIIYPNPVRDILNVKLDNNSQAITLKIFSANGQLQLSQKYSQSLTLIPVSVKRLPAGTYHLVIEKASGENKTITFIKE
ncbi:MAG: T9SS type A sorting domain-containing protein [Ginsengibacter sp.]|jgi:hypothetical protein